MTAWSSIHLFHFVYKNAVFAKKKDEEPVELFVFILIDRRTISIGRFPLIQ